MQPRPFKFRHLDRIAGAFLFMTFMILAVLVILGAKSQQWFAEVSYYRVELPASSVGETESTGTLGIKPGSVVRVVGSQVGFVKSVDLCRGVDLQPIESFTEVTPSEIRIVALLSVKGDFAEFIGPDSKAVLKFDLGGLGSSYFDLSRGTRRFVKKGDIENPHILPFSRESDAKEEIFEVVKRIEEELVPAINSIEKTADSATLFIEQISNKDEVLYRTLTSLETGVGDLNKVIARAERGEGALGDMISEDSQMRKEFNEFATTLNRTTANLEKAIDNLDDGITDLREDGINSFNEAAKNFPTTVRKTNATIDDIDIAARQLNETLREIEVLTEGLQNHWLVRGAMKDEVEDAPARKKQSRQAPEPRQKGGETENKGLLKRLFQKKDKD